MKKPVQEEWSRCPPGILVCGDGPYAGSLAFVLNAARMSARQLESGPEPNSGGRFPRLLDCLTQAILVIPDSMSASDTLQCHRLMWDWVKKLTRAGDQHDLAVLFILPVDASDTYVDAIAVGLGVRDIDPVTTGHAVWRPSGALPELIGVLAKIRPKDWVSMQARQASDSRHTALARLHDAIARDNFSVVKEAACNVASTFSGHEYQLDLFCRPPSHHHGKLLRAWLKEAVTNSVTPDGWADRRKQIAEWLAYDEHCRIS